MEKKLMRIGISLPGELLDKFDRTLLKRGYCSRSEGKRDAIRTYNQRCERVKRIRGKKAATISIYLWLLKNRDIKHPGKDSAWKHGSDKFLSTFPYWAWFVFWGYNSEWPRGKNRRDGWKNSKFKRSQLFPINYHSWRKKQKNGLKSLIFWEWFEIHLFSISDLKFHFKSWE